MAGIMYEKDETAISRAILNNDLNSLKEALKSKEDIHYKDRKGNTYLHYLCTMPRPFLIHVIVGAGIDLNAQNRHGNTALHVTALQNDCCHVGDLMAAGVDPNLKNNKGLTAAEIPNKNKFWKTVYDKYHPGIFEAITAHDVDKVLHLLHCWSRVYTMRNGLTLRHFAAALKYHDLVYHIDYHRHTVGAIYAVLEGDEERAQRCMSSAKCDINFLNYAMESKHILQEALKQRNFKLVHLICAARVNVNIMVRIHNHIKAPLFFAALDPKLSGRIMWTVLKAGADFSMRDERGRNAGIYALDKWKGEIPLEVIIFMLKNGLDISYRDETGVTLRDVARFARRKDILTLIDKAYVKVIRTSNIPELERLCRRGYDGMLINFNYRDTFIYASGNETDEVLSFTQWIPKFFLQKRKLYHCIQYKSLEEFTKVFENCDKPRLLLNAVDKGGRAAIHKCVMFWRSDILKELIKRNCEMNLQDNIGRTAYHYACALEEEDERKELSSILLKAGIDPIIKDLYGHEAEFNIDNKGPQAWLAKERKTTYGMPKQLNCVDKYEELRHMMKHRNKTLKHFNAAICHFKYPVPRFEEILKPLMPQYKDLLQVAIDCGKEDIAVCLVKLGTNLKRVDKINVSVTPAAEENQEEQNPSLVEKAKLLGMNHLVEVIEKQMVYEKKIAQRKNDEENRIKKTTSGGKISKIRKMSSGLNEEEKISQDADEDYEDVLFEEEVVSDSDGSEDDLGENKSDNVRNPQTDTDDNLLIQMEDFDVSFYSDDFDVDVDI